MPRNISHLKTLTIEAVTVMLWLTSMWEVGADVTNAAWRLSNPFRPAEQCLALATNSGVQAGEARAQSVDVFQGRLYYITSHDETFEPFKVYAFEPDTRMLTNLLSGELEFTALRALKGKLYISRIDGRLYQYDGIQVVEKLDAPFDWGNCVTAMAEFQDRLYFGTRNGAIYRSDSGDDFSQVGSLSADENDPVTDLEVWHNHLYGINYEWYAYSAKIFRTHDGTDWDVVETSQTYGFGELLPTPTHLYAASVEDADGPSYAIRASPDGTNWTRIFYTESEGKSSAGPGVYCAQTGRAYFTIHSGPDYQVRLVPVFAGVVEERIVLPHALNSLRELGGRLFGIGAESPENWDLSPHVVCLLGNYETMSEPLLLSPVASMHGIQLPAIGMPGRNYVLEASSDFIKWTPLQTNRPAGSVFYFTDTAAAGSGQRFYRMDMQ